jgi:hypothetical protein
MDLHKYAVEKLKEESDIELVAKVNHFSNFLFNYAMTVFYSVTGYYLENDDMDSYNTFHDECSVTQYDSLLKKNFSYLRPYNNEFVKNVCREVYDFYNIQREIPS